MENFLQNHEVEQEIIEAIRKSILATKLPHQPESFLEEIICDANTYI